MTAVVVFLFGLALGSFLNVCIYRLPRGESVISPRSRCPHCQQLIAAYDNIPLLSYLILRGRCRYCRARISPLYPLVELATAVLLVAIYFRHGFTPLGVKSTLLMLALVVLIVTDLRERILPDRVTYPGLGVGLLLALWIPVGDGSAAAVARALALALSPRILSFADALLGALLWAAMLYVVGELFYRVRKLEGLGLGDVKMMAMLGAFFGLKLTLLTLLLGCFLGIILGGVFMLLTRKGRRYELPLGSFLGLAALLTLFWGDALLRWYASILTF